ncbi:MAG TPA: TraR/DksA family transcriptional regulator [Bacteroidetes bacterium]|nr:TraR/DksA family transcriptional regulator [Bacteroidota bacterium]
MTDQEKKEFHEKLLSEREKIKDEILTLEDKTKPISPENSLGRISRMDAINNKGVAEFSLRQAKRRLNAVNAWLSKYNSDAFGKCARCKNEIPVKRLMFMPHSLKCMHCAGR